MKLILLGAPGAGKGTQAAVISRELGIPAISTGNILRAAIQEGTPTGMKPRPIWTKATWYPMSHHRHH